MKSLSFVTALGLMLGAGLAVPPSTEAADRDGRSGRGYSDGRDRSYRGYDRSYRDNDRSYRGYDRSYRDNDRSYRSYDRSHRSYGRSYGHRYRRPYPSYSYSYGYEPYYQPYYEPSYEPYYDSYGYCEPPAYYARPYPLRRHPRPRIGLYFGW